MFLKLTLIIPHSKTCNQQVLNQNKYSLFNQFIYSSRQIKELDVVNFKLNFKVKEDERIQEVLEA